MKEYKIKFDNHIENGKYDVLPEHKGIYLFRVSVPTSDNHIDSFIVYIGKADGEKGLKGRINDGHEHIADAKKLIADINSKLLTSDKKCRLTISYSEKADYSNDDIERIEAALIFYKKPILNDKCKFSFTYEKTIVNVSGEHKADLDEKCVAEKTE